MSSNPVRALTALAGLTIACAGHFAPQVDKSYLSWIAAGSRCPVVGMSYRQAVAAWGKPDSVRVVEGDSVTYFKGAGRTILAVRFQRDTTRSWSLRGVPTVKIAYPQPDWSVNQTDGFKERVSEYIRRKELSPEQRYALWRSCPQVGMTETDLVASWGKPQERHVVDSDPREVALIYGYGVEGQHDSLHFRNDSLVSMEYNAGAFELVEDSIK